MYARKVVDMANVRRKSATVEELRVYLGGDLVEGEDIFPHQAHLIDVPLLEQAVRTGPSIFVEQILYFLKHFTRVQVIAVPGNHGRASFRGHPRTNWDTVTGDFLRGVLLGSPEYPRTELAERLSIEVSPDFYMVDKLPGGWNNLLVHGHQITGGYAGFPFYGAAKAISGWSDSIHEPWDYLWFGHFHTFGSMVVNHRLWLANGTTESDNEYAREKIKSHNVPCQRLAFFNERHGLISDHQIFLDTRTPQSRRFTSGDRAEL